MEWTPVLRLLAAAGFAAAIGIDRELRAKPAGLRTNIVVGVASAAFGYVSVSGFDLIGGYDPSRVAAQVVSGVGFLGGGAIFAAGGKPHGLTTAAALWGAAASGVAAGVGELTTGLWLVLITVVALRPLDWLTRVLFGQRRRDDVNVHVIVADLSIAQDVRETFREVGVRLVDLQLAPFGDAIEMQATVHGTRPQVAEATGLLRGNSGVSFLAEESLPPEQR